MDKISSKSTVRRVFFPEKTVSLIGTAHVSGESVREVEKVLDIIRPDTVCVELCEERYHAMRQGEERPFEFWKMVRKSGFFFTLLHFLMYFLYKRLGAKFGVKPGAEMLAGIEWAETHGARVVLCDQNANTTMRSLWESLNWWGRIRFMAHLIATMGGIGKRVDEELVEELKTTEKLEETVDEFNQAFPALKKRLIDERDEFMADEIASTYGNDIVVIIGIGHLRGIEMALSRFADEEWIETMAYRG